ncbi:uracil-DNA glycosylase [Hydrogenophaga sp. PAMC20947]|nr:uracil-DNA glycosylase [Hydrogenophaga sp. PAMC20947]
MSAPVDISFVPDLDARQRAMLAEMGVRVWAPKRALERAPVPEAQEAAVAAPPPPPVTTATTTPPARAVAEPARARAPVAEPSPPAPVAPAPLVAPVADGLDWPALQVAVGACEACGLCRSRKQAVLGTGSRLAHWMVVGEAPDEHDDAQGEPFSQQAGQLLDNMLAAVGVSREGAPEHAAYLTQALKCRPPASRSASAEEAAQCEPYLARQLELVQPRIILAMGRMAAQSMLQTKAPLGRLRGQVHQYRGVPLIATYDLGYLLRTPAAKREAWADLCLALETLRGA